MLKVSLILCSQRNLYHFTSGHASPCSALAPPLWVWSNPPTSLTSRPKSCGQLHSTLEAVRRVCRVLPVPTPYGDCRVAARPPAVVPHTGYLEEPAGLPRRVQASAGMLTLGGSSVQTVAHFGRTEGHVMT